MNFFLSSFKKIAQHICDVFFRVIKELEVTLDDLACLDILENLVGGDLRV